MHLVYVVSASYRAYLQTALWFLYRSGTLFAQITVLVPGPEPLRLHVADPRVTVRRVADISDGYWHVNKALVGLIEDDDVVFLDADVLVLKPLHQAVAGLDADVAARSVWNAATARSKEGLWSGLLNQFGARQPAPYMNTGMIVFHNGAHKRVMRQWADLTRAVRHMNPNPLGYAPEAEQQAFSLAVAQRGLRCGGLSEQVHAYAWKGESSCGVCAYHTGCPNFFWLAHEVAVRIGQIPGAVPVRLPNLRLHHCRTRASRKLRRLTTQRLSLFNGGQQARS